MNNLDYARVLREAADRIENLDHALEAQRQLLEKTSEHTFRLQEAVLKYDGMLGEAEERLRKAEEDFKHSITEGDPCEICVGYREDFGCEDADLCCIKCKCEDCYCKDCRDMNK